MNHKTTRDESVLHAINQVMEGLANGESTEVSLNQEEAVKITKENIDSYTNRGPLQVLSFWLLELDESIKLNEEIGRAITLEEGKQLARNMWKAQKALETWLKARARKLAKPEFEIKAVTKDEVGEDGYAIFATVVDDTDLDMPRYTFMNKKIMSPSTTAKDHARILKNMKENVVLASNMNMDNWELI